MVSSPTTSQVVVNQTTTILTTRARPVAYGLWCLALLGVCGVHRFYMGKYVTGILWLLTFGFCYVGQAIDLLLIEGWFREQAPKQ
jgi:TM2 domain-containing membrane protein YozV